MKPHKWAKEIKAWADGAEIQFKDSNDTNEWFDTKEPTWEILDFLEYRIKPQPKEPQYLYVWLEPSGNYKFGKFAISYNGMKPIGKIKLETEND